MTRGRHEEAVGDFLPLPNATFHILLALRKGEKHGYAIMQDIAERTSGKIHMSPGTLYGAISRLLEKGLISELRDAGRPGKPRPCRRPWTRWPSSRRRTSGT